MVQSRFDLETHRRCQMVDITSQVASAVREAGIRQGDVTVFCLHTTAGITINENADASVQHDILLTLEKLIPQD
ncbi:MAG TPA: YjbQ family protein, partial [Phycisphaerales bacterium]|nr:YjbQ family protein [Phycisphaerales bacterium]